MALMLMGEIEHVVAEVARVLSPGGALACVVGGGAVGGEAYERFLALLRATIEEAPAAQRIPALGDRRARSREGLDELLGPAGFAAVDWETVPIDLSGPVEQVWVAVSGLYDLGPLAPATVDRLRRAFLAEVRDMTTSDGHGPCAFNIHLATARRRWTVRPVRSRSGCGLPSRVRGKAVHGGRLRCGNGWRAFHSGRAVRG